MINFPETKAIKDSIRDAIGQSVVFVIGGEATACSTCSGLNLYDSVNELSLNQFCTVCSGSYWIVSDTQHTITAHVRHRTGDESDWGIAGDVLVGDCIMTIGIDELSDNQIVKIKKVFSDDREFRIFKTIKRGVPTRDRVRFLCRLVGKE